MGAVYEASHVRLEGRYAVKFLRPEVAAQYPAALARFRREARITSALRHPGIVQVIDFHTPPDGPPFMVMEYLDGAILAEVIAREAPLSLARVCDLTSQIASALLAAHRKGVVHRDLNPANVVVLPADGDQPERVKILDFGISKMRWASKQLTGTAQVLGTPQYMAPEQAEGRTKDLDPTADQFSLAAIVYEMLTGQAAFAGETLATAAYQVVHATPVPASRMRGDLGPGVDAALARGLAKDRRERFASVVALAVAFRRAAFPQVPGAGPCGGAAGLASDTVVAPSAFLQDPSLNDDPGAGPPRSRGEQAPTVILRRRRRLIVLARRARRGWARLLDLLRARPVLAVGAVAAALLAVVLVVHAARARQDPPRAARVVLADARPSSSPVVLPIAPPPPAPPAPAPAPPEAVAAVAAPPVRAHALRVKAEDSEAVTLGPDDDAPLETEVEIGAGPAPASCSLTLGSSPWASVWLDGRDTGLHTPVVQLPLSCGTHVLQLKRQDLRLAHQATVVLHAGDHLKARYALEPGD
jgi:serine/threonine-protein kinase